jgi:hypothetical protein
LEIEIFGFVCGGRKTGEHFWILVEGQKIKGAQWGLWCSARLHRLRKPMLSDGKTTRKLKAIAYKRNFKISS